MTEQQRLLALMESVEAIKQAINALVQALVSDGFDDEQARIIVTGFYRSLYRIEEES